MNISLIGMMGSGKSTIGKLLEEKLSGYSFIDTDSEIVNLERRTINEIFSQDGEQYFRRIEANVLKKILLCDKQIISTGGGIITSDENISLLKEKSVVFYLKASADNLFSRVKNNKERPLLNVDNMYDKIKLILSTREEKYNQAHYIIDTNDNSKQNTVNKIMEILNDNRRS